MSGRTTTGALAAAIRHARDDGYEPIVEEGYPVTYRWRDIKTGELLPGSYKSAVQALRSLCPVTEALVNGLPGATIQDSADKSEDCKIAQLKKRRRG